jgi:hypothetical protein
MYQLAQEYTFRLRCHSALPILCDIHTAALSHLDSLHMVWTFSVSLPRLAQRVEKVANELALNSLAKQSSTTASTRDVAPVHLRLT